MGTPRTDVLKTVTRAICGQDGERAQQKNKQESSRKEKEQPPEEGQVPVDHPTAASEHRRQQTFTFTYLT